MVRIREPYVPKPRLTLTGNLVDLSAPQEAKIYDGVYEKLDFRIDDGLEQHRISAYHRDGIDVSSIPDLREADLLVAGGANPRVRMRYYENRSEKTGKTYKNATLRDLEEGFELLG